MSAEVGIGQFPQLLIRSGSNTAWKDLLSPLSVTIEFFFDVNASFRMAFEEESFLITPLCYSKLKGTETIQISKIVDSSQKIRYFGLILFEGGYLGHI